MFSFIAQLSIILTIIAIACTQVFLLLKYMHVRGTLRRMQETSSGDHIRYKNGAAARHRNGNGNSVAALNKLYAARTPKEKPPAAGDPMLAAAVVPPLDRSFARSLDGSIAR